jgi:hypothetical protein
MGKIYTLGIVNKAAQREAKLISLLDDSNEEVFDIPFEFIWTKNNKIQKQMNLKIKVYKTLGGATRECGKINTKYANKSMRLTEGYYNTDRRWTNSFNFDTSQYSFVVIDITEKWNLHIDSEIQKETAKYNREVQKLNSLKVNHSV